MKKVLLLAFVGAMLALSATAFAADGGHVKDITPDTTNFVEVKITSAEITTGNAAVTVASVTPAKADAVSTAKFSLTDDTMKPVILGAIELDLAHDSYTSGDVVLTFPAYGVMGFKTKPGYAWLKNKVSSEYDRFTITATDNAMTITVPDITKYFTTGTVMFGNETKVPSGDSGGSGGCNAAAAPFMLLLGALPLLYFRKK